jgi:hypothetical protein
MSEVDEWSHQPAFLDKAFADEVLDWAMKQTVQKYPYRGREWKRSPKIEFAKDDTVSTYRFGQETSAYALVQYPFPEIIQRNCDRIGDPNINHVIFTRYDHGKEHHIPWHSDKQVGTSSAGAKDIRPSTDIWNVVVCKEPRVFQVARAEDIPKSTNGHAEPLKYVFNQPLHLKCERESEI